MIAGIGYIGHRCCHFTYGNTAQFPPDGLSTAPAAAAPRSLYRHLELCGIALYQKTHQSNIEWADSTYTLNVE